MGLLLVLCGLTEFFLQAIETLAPEAAVEGEPVGGTLQRLPASGCSADAGRRGSDDEPGLLQHLQMTRHGGQRDGEGLGQLVDRALALGQAQKNGSAGGIGERRESLIEL
jgi:hypothetical protein